MLAELASSNMFAVAKALVAVGKYVGASTERSICASACWRLSLEVCSLSADTVDVHDLILKIHDCVRINIYIHIHMATYLLLGW